MFTNVTFIGCVDPLNVVVPGVVCTTPFKTVWKGDAKAQVLNIGGVLVVGSNESSVTVYVPGESWHAMTLPVDESVV
jgi:hypothetical protein